MPTRSATNPDRTDTGHLVQLFDTDQSVVDRVAEFVRLGLVHNEQILLVMSEERWNAVAMRLSALGCSVDEALRVGHVIVRDAHDTLEKFMVGDKPHRPLFAATVGSLVEDQTASGRRVRIYGEMVDVLAGEGQYKAALELEQLWNEVAEQREFTLLCGYTAAHFGDPRNAEDLRQVCAAHSGVVSDPLDVLGSYLVNRHDVSVVGPSTG
jgi:hypothetical protein